jgi:hypothetical protein
LSVGPPFEGDGLTGQSEKKEAATAAGQGLKKTNSYLAGSRTNRWLTCCSTAAREYNIGMYFP